jgi:hypothetical protein
MWIMKSKRLSAMAIMAATVLMVGTAGGSVISYASPSVKEQVDVLNQTVSIPGRMEPESIIEFISDTQYVILQGGEYDETAAYAKLDETLYSGVSIEVSEGECGEVVCEDPIVAVTGMKISYADDGYILRISNKNNAQKSYINDLARAAAVCPSCKKTYLSAGTTSPVGTYTWGDSSNKLVVTSTTVKGTGRFTNFTDKKGSHDNDLKKGDVATRYHVDNPKDGTTISCKANGYTVNMSKEDVGCLPDAVLDIWKTGMDSFGKTWTSSLSYSNAEYSYTK